MVYMTEEKYKETFGILVAVLAIIAFMVSTAEFVAFKETPYIDGQIITKEGVKANFYNVYMKPALFLIGIFLLYVVNKNFIIRRPRIISITKGATIFIIFVYFLLYVQVTYHIKQLAPLLYFSTADLDTAAGTFLASIRLGSISGILIDVMLIFYAIIAIWNFGAFVFGKFRRKERRTPVIKKEVKLITRIATRKSRKEKAGMKQTATKKKIPKKGSKKIPKKAKSGI